VFAAALAVVTWNVVAGIGLARLDPHVERVAVAHRAGWATSVLKVLTWLGSGAVLWPLVGLATGLLVVRSRRWREAAFLLLALAGSAVLSDVVKPLADRARPPASLHLVRVTGLAYPSGHSMDAMAAYAALAVVVGAGRSGRSRALIAGIAAVLIAVVGWSRLYLGVHWLTDVVGGFLLSACWVSLLVAVLLPETFRLPGGPTRTGPYRPGLDR